MKNLLHEKRLRETFSVSEEEDKLSEEDFENVLNSFTAGLRPANLAPAPGQICKQTLSYHKTRKYRFSVSFLVSFELSFIEEIFGHKKCFIQPYLPRARACAKNARYVKLRRWSLRLSMVMT